jgi:dTDP-4-dehydrorhamnose 3,5-epimerase
MNILKEPLRGTFLLQPPVFADFRGEFTKSFHRDLFAKLGISFTPVESFHSTSKQGVLRGMHFQVPPHDHAKLVYCARGKALDVVVDLRKNSPSFGQAASAILSAENHHQLFIPSGLAHGFLALESNTLLMYMTSTIYAPSHDTGVRWDSFGFNWGDPAPIVSARDQDLPPLDEFTTPFL